MTSTNPQEIPSDPPASSPVSGDDENVAPSTLKEWAEQFDREDILLDMNNITLNCDMVRRRLRAITDKKELLVKDVCNALGVSNQAYNRFMGQSGAFNGQGCDTYVAGMAFLSEKEEWEKAHPESKKKKSAAGTGKKRKSAGAGDEDEDGALTETDGNKSTPAKKAKKNDSSAAKDGSSSTPKSTKKKDAQLDISSIELPGEAANAVPVFDTCDVVRRKITQHLQKDGMTAAAFCRELAEQYNPPKKVNSQTLTRFRGNKGPISGAKSPVFYAAYVFFEKERIAKGAKKTKFREEMEIEWMERGGMDLEVDANTMVFGSATSRGGLNKYGKSTGF